MDIVWVPSAHPVSRENPTEATQEIRHHPRMMGPAPYSGACISADTVLGWYNLSSCTTQ